MKDVSRQSTGILSMGQYCSIRSDTVACLQVVVFRKLSLMCLCYTLASACGLDWIYDRFAGVEAAAGCSIQTLKPSRGTASTDFDGWADQT